MGSFSPSCPNIYLWLKSVSLQAVIAKSGGHKKLPLRGAYQMYFFYTVFTMADMFYAFSYRRIGFLAAWVSSSLLTIVL